ncbi:tRNA uridine-5-carboxymethylaminomethyl(34) synthesis GTPase MnmE [Treponema zioleckii]|uniref:tRNA uridine-5-carboxymethylaminomethyl(34) synthesis GTPase MnmE n=1 Tax=Treponema zioleckii TaxID=331680 RepID=UPI00168A54FA|nr:tRNA uridine-5-carboxymethylaminomethyl(34) synthesis GTPase MnmE [Treponema zioleckii]
MDNTGYTPEEPIAAIATALAPAALGIIRASGKGCIEKVSKLFSRPKALLSAAPNSIVYGWIVNPVGSVRVDEVLLSVFKSPKSFTGEDMVEISCHGGVSVVTAIYNLLLLNGFRPAERGEFTFRAYINGKTDLTRAEAIREIIDSKTDASRSRAAGRLAGNLYDSIDSVKKLIVDTLASIEVDIEYPEDEETIADSFDSSDLRLAEKKLDALASSWKSEKIYQDGARVVLCGRTNAGKSSLFNALLKEDRAIVSDIEGTTRDFIESWVDFDGIPARLFDTAGLRETSDVIEQRGVERTRDLSEDADLILYLVDSVSGIDDDDKDFLTSVSKNLPNTPLILVLTKADKSAPPQVSGLTVQNLVSISSKTGEGLASLSSLVKKLLSKGEKSDRNQAGLGSERQKVAVEQALECVRHALSLSEDYALDAVVQDLEDSLDFLGEVTGSVTPDDVLGSIFARFCVGK